MTKPSSDRLPLSYSQIFTRLKEKTDVDFKPIKRFSDDHPDGPLADLGAGFGRLLGAGITRPMVLIENDAEMLVELKKRVGADPRLTVLEESVFSTSLENDSVGACVIAYASLSEMRPIAFALAEAFRILKVGGGLFAVMLNPEFGVTNSRGTTAPADDAGDFSASLLTFPASNLGEFEFFTEVKARGIGWERSTVLRQIYPSVSRLSEILKTLGFTDIKVVNAVDGGAFDPASTAVYEITAKKSDVAAAEPLQAALLEFYDGIAGSYDKVMTDGKYEGISWLKKEIAKFRSTFPRVLDLGCANGSVARALTEEQVHPRMFGLDFSLGMVVAARSSGLYESVIQWDLAKSYPILEGTEFDLVTMLGVSEFLPNIQDLLVGIRKSLIVGGRALITFELTREGIKPSGSTVTESGMRKYHYSLKEVERLADLAGLKIVSISNGFAYTSPTLAIDVPYIYAHFVRGTL